MSEEINFDMILRSVTELPMVKVDRVKFLEAAL